jgi:DNA polymerase iota
VQKGYTCTAGISTNKELSKLVGNLYKPHAQTTLLPPYDSEYDNTNNVTLFLDDHEVGRIPGIGFKIAQKLRALVQERPAQLDKNQADETSEEKVLVGDVRRLPGMNAETLEQELGGPGIPRGIGTRIWDLLNGRDDTEVGQARDVPRQISIEDSYGRLDTEEAALKELQKLAVSLIKRMHADLTSIAEEDENIAYQATETAAKGRRWLAIPKTIRLSTCPRGPQNPDGSRSRSSARISRSAPMPKFMFSLKDSVASLADRLVVDVLIHLFRKLHPDKRWNLSLVNVAATNIVDAASEKGGPGKDIATMFRRQDDVLKQWRVEEEHNVDNAVESDCTVSTPNDRKLEGRNGSEELPTRSQEEPPSGLEEWQSGDEDMTEDDLFRCECGAMMPAFAMAAHDRWHAET